MTTRTMEATAVHTVTVAATQSVEARTVACDVRDVFDAPTRAVDVSVELRSKTSPAKSSESEVSEERIAATGERTKLWTRHPSNNASTAAFAATEVLAVRQAASSLKSRWRLRASAVARVALGLVVVVATVLASYGASNSLGGGESKVSTTAPAAQSPGTVGTPDAPGPTRVALSEKEQTALEAAAVDALLSGKPGAALLRYRELAASGGGHVFSRVAKILEHAP